MIQHAHDDGVGLVKESACSECAMVQLADGAAGWVCLHQPQLEDWVLASFSYASRPALLEDL